MRSTTGIPSWNQRHFSFYDDALLVTPNEMAIPLLKEIIRRDLPIHFHCPNGLHLREITSEVSMLLFNAGFETIRFGFETSDPLRQGMTGGKVDNGGIGRSRQSSTTCRLSK